MLIMFVRMCGSHLLRLIVMALVAFGGQIAAAEPPPPSASAAAPEADSSTGSQAVTPFIAPVPTPVDQPVDWQALSRHSTAFLGVMHGFRLATEEGTREGLKGPFFAGYADSIGAMHGWSDGDPFLVNYVGHPMQGAAAAYMFVASDPKYRTFQFGRDRRYWKSRLRGAAFAWLFSTQFEIGPISEASIGNIQKKYPANGFVDHVITPVLGLGWMVAEDALDRHVIRWVEHRSDATWVRMVARLGLNPARSFANLMSFRNPWRRDDRPTIYWDYEAEDRLRKSIGPAAPAEIPTREWPVFELTAQPQAYWFGAGSSLTTTCVGGGALAQYHVSRNWALVADVGGCRLLNLEPDRTGDSLTYLFGPRWNGRPSGRWSPHVRVLVGGNKVTQTEWLPEQIRELEEAGIDWKKNEYHSEIANDYDKNAFAFLLGGGVDVVLHPAVSLQVANFDYLHTRLKEFRGRDYTHNVRFTAGLTLRVGTW